MCRRIWVVPKQERLHEVELRGFLKSDIDLAVHKGANLLLSSFRDSGIAGPQITESK